MRLLVKVRNNIAVAIAGRAYTRARRRLQLPVATKRLREMPQKVLLQSPRQIGESIEDLAVLQLIGLPLHYTPFLLDLLGILSLS